VLQAYFIVALFLLLLRFVGILDELLLLADNFEKQIYVFKIADGEVAHEILAIDLGYLPHRWVFLMHVFAAKVILSESMLALRFHRQETFASFETDGGE
jgi:hypothetical protein